MYTTQAISTSYPRVLPIKLLFAPYTVVFVALITIFANYLLKLGLQNIFPTSAEQLLVLGIIFENPHIAASNVMILQTKASSWPLSYNWSITRTHHAIWSKGFFDLLLYLDNLSCNPSADRHWQDD